MRRSKFAANYSPAIVSDNMSGKMAGIPSISTSVLENPICQKRRQDPNSICAKCFAASTAARYSSLAKNLKSNLELLTGEILPADVLPRFIPELSNIVRFESFGDLANVNQAINYLNIAKVNPGVRFAIWTKNIGILAKAVETVGKPENIRIIYSAPIVNHAIDVEKTKQSFPYVDAVFTVYDKKHAAENNVEINCGAKSCITCRNCYDRSDFYSDIKEQLK
jgi:hypothetical protein